MFEAQYVDATTTLQRFQVALDEIERTNDVGRKREIVQLLVSGVRVYTEVSGGRKSDARLTIS